MSQDPQTTRQAAQEQYRVNPQTPMAGEQSTASWETRNTYNAELYRLRSNDQSGT